MRGGARAGPGPVAVTLVASAAVVVGTMPASLLGASSVLLGPELGMGPSEIGAAVGGFYAAQTVCAVPGGRAADRWGPRATLCAAAVLSVATLLSVALVVETFAGLMVVTVASGALSGLLQPASSLALAQGTFRRQGLMFGIKQTAVPVASLLAGLLVPVVGVTLGWRWSFGFAALLAALVAGVVLRLPGRARSMVRRPRAPLRHRAALVALGASLGLGTAAGTSLAAFLVPFAATMGASVTAAGFLLVAGSLAAVVARLLAGWSVDRPRAAPFLIMPAMLAVGAVGHILLAPGIPVLLPWGALLAFAGGWGWTGVVVFVAVRMSQQAAASAAGVLQTGGAAGAAVGPVSFGLVVETTSYSWAWAVAAGLTLLAGILVLGTRIRLLRSDVRVPA